MGEENWINSPHFLAPSPNTGWPADHPLVGASDGRGVEEGVEEKGRC